jgi:inhibitor of cysteine peptidase
VKTVKWAVVLMLWLAAMLFAACVSGFESPEQVGPAAIITSVEIEQWDGEYYAIVDGQHSVGCAETGDIEQEVEDNTIKVRIQSTRPEAEARDETSTPFTEEIALDVSGLSAGQYTVDVNGTVATLTLMEDH